MPGNAADLTVELLDLLSLLHDLGGEEGVQGGDFSHAAFYCSDGISPSQQLPLHIVMSLLRMVAY